MPTRWTGWIVLIASIMISAMFLLSFLIKYPDTMDGQISITANKAPVRLVSATAGRIHLLKTNQAIMKPGCVIAYIE